MSLFLGGGGRFDGGAFQAVLSYTNEKMMMKISALALLSQVMTKPKMALYGSGKRSRFQIFQVRLQQFQTRIPR